MISYIVASNDSEVLYSNLLDTLKRLPGDEIIVEEDPPSIAVAYNRGTVRASNRIKCYVHHDVQVLDSARLRSELVEHCTSEVGIVGVIGSATQVIPWWEGRGCGSVIDGRTGHQIYFTTGGEICTFLDGLLLATAQDVVWDESYPGFHYYDHDICQQMLFKGLKNYCLEDGKSWLLHNTRGPGNLSRIPGWFEAEATFKEKWGFP